MLFAVLVLIDASKKKFIKLEAICDSYPQWCQKVHTPAQPWVPAYKRITDISDQPANTRQYRPPTVDRYGQNLL